MPRGPSKLNDKRGRAYAARRDRDVMRLSTCERGSLSTLRRSFVALGPQESTVRGASPGHHLFDGDYGWRRFRTAFQGSSRPACFALRRGLDLRGDGDAFNSDQMARGFPAATLSW